MNSSALGRGIHRFTQLQITETKKHAKWHFVIKLFAKGHWEFIGLQIAELQNAKKHSQWLR
jgi:hypothetical protein